MPIDTAEKRRSAAGVPSLPVGPGVTPDASQDEAWRQQAGWGYSGIPTSAPIVVGAVVYASFLSVPGVRTATVLPGVRNFLVEDRN